MLCEVCSRMFEALFRRPSQIEGGQGEHHQTWNSFLDASKAGCYVCEPMIQLFFEVEKREDGDFTPFGYRLYPNLVADAVSMHVITTIYLEFFHHWGRGKHAYEWAGDSLVLISAPTLGFASQESLNLRTRTLSNLEAEAVPKIKRWMDICLQDHQGAGCLKDGTNITSYPSRLLELSQDSSIRVFETAVYRPTSPYVALSYCWGPNPTFLKLTSQNKKELEAGFPVSSLPLAFREAISIIRRLGLRYLWIDALCILQSGPGSAEDWQNESATMHQVYTDSILTLSLSVARSPDESIFSVSYTGTTVTPPFEVRADSEDPDSETLTIVSADYFHKALYEQPLSHRAWALQERVMATRVVSFGLGELFWDCAQLPNACETIPGGLQATHLQFKEQDTPKEVLFGLKTKSIPRGSDNKVLLDTWYNLMEEYTKRRLTHPRTDKLVALSAIAFQLGKAMDDVYIAGHFWKTLPGTLQWAPEDSIADDSKLQRWGGRARKICGSQATTSEFDVLCAPSWSWASMDGPIFWNNRVRNPLADAVSYTVNSASETDPTGPRVSATLSIRAYCTEVQWYNDKRPAYCTEVQWYNDKRPVIVARTEEWADLNLSRLEITLDEPDVPRQDGIRFLMVAISENIRWAELSGLVLEEVLQEGETRYKRVGHFGIDGGRRAGSTWWDEKVSVFGGEKRLIKLI